MLSAFRRIFFPVLLVLGGKWEQWGSLETSKLETRFQNLGKVVGGLPRFGGFEVVFSSFQGDLNLLAQPRNSKLDFRTQKHIPWCWKIPVAAWRIRNQGGGGHLLCVRVSPMTHVTTGHYSLTTLIRQHHLHP